MRPKPADKLEYYAAGGPWRISLVVRVSIHLNNWSWFTTIQSWTGETQALSDQDGKRPAHRKPLCAIGHFEGLPPPKPRKKKKSESASNNRALKTTCVAFLSFRHAATPPRHHITTSSLCPRRHTATPPRATTSPLLRSALGYSVLTSLTSTLAAVRSVRTTKLTQVQTFNQQPTTNNQQPTTNNPFTSYTIEERLNMVISQLKRDFLVVELHHDGRSVERDPDLDITLPRVGFDSAMATFLRGEKLEFSTLRHAKYSTMMLLHALFMDDGAPLPERFPDEKQGASKATGEQHSHSQHPAIIGDGGTGEAPGIASIASIVLPGLKLGGMGAGAGAGTGAGAYGKMGAGDGKGIGSTNGFSFTTLESGLGRIMGAFGANAFGSSAAAFSSGSGAPLGSIADGDIVSNSGDAMVVNATPAMGKGGAYVDSAAAFNTPAAAADPTTIHVSGLAACAREPFAASNDASGVVHVAAAHAADPNATNSNSNFASSSTINTPPLLHATGHAGMQLSSSTTSNSCSNSDSNTLSLDQPGGRETGPKSADQDAFKDDAMEIEPDGAETQVVVVADMAVASATGTVIVPPPTDVRAADGV
jgi:hypothetical protein